MKIFFLILLGLSLPLEAKEEDIPSKGASYFDYLTQKAGIKYDGRPLPQKPHPYKTLIKSLNQYSPYFSAIIPFGRSLQKMAAYPDSLKFPRLLVATEIDKSGLNAPFRGGSS